MDRRALLRTPDMTATVPTTTTTTTTLSTSSEGITQPLPPVEEPRPIRNSVSSQVSATSAVPDSSKLQKKLIQDTEREKLQQAVEELKQTAEKQTAAYAQLRSDYENMERNYTKLKEQAQEAVGKYS